VQVAGGTTQVHFGCSERNDGKRTVRVISEAGGASRPARYWGAFLGALTLGLVAAALLGLALHFISYAKAKAFFDWYLAADGVSGKAATDLTAEAYRRFSGRLPIAAGVFGICAVTLALFKRKLLCFLLAIPSEWTVVRTILRDQFPEGTKNSLEIGIVSTVFAIGIFLRAWHLGRAVRYDEAWTYVEFASRPLVFGLSNYTAPNNHLLNTFLVHFSTQLFGDTVFGLRFPALAAGCLVILASWFVARAHYGQLAGILTAGCVAALPTFIEFSINARGYALQWLSVLAVMWFAIVLQGNPSLRIGWLGLVIAGVAGVYSIPTTLIAIAGVFGWMLASTFADGGASKIEGVFRNVALAGIAIVLLSLLLYVPPLVVGGPGALVARSVVELQQRDFTKGLERMSRCAWVYWAGGVPTVALWILLGGLAIALLFHRRICGHRVPMMIALWLAAALFAWALNVFAFPRVWSYLLLCTVMTACAGLSLVLTSLAGRSRTRRVVLVGVAVVALAVFVGARVIQQRVLFTSNEGGMIIDADAIVDYLSMELRPGDSLVSNAIINYELLRRKPELYGSLVKPEESARVVAVAVKRTGSTEFCTTGEAMAVLATQEAADPKSLADRIELNAYKAPEVGAKFLTSTVYFLARKGEGGLR
jgi:Dolichyl-phosphate-mannose-protein mannosyltransferase